MAAMSERNDDKRRRNLRTALWTALLALGFYVAFFWSMSHRGS